MLDKIFDKLPYEKLEKIQFIHLLMGAFGIGALLMAIYFFTLYSAGQEESTALLAKKTEVEKKLKADELLVAQSGAVGRELAALVQNLSDAKRQMPGSDEMPRLLRKVSESEKDLSMEILLLRVEEGKVRDYYKEIPLSIQIRGGFWNSVGFFDRVQDLLQAVTFSELKMEKPEEKAKSKKGKGKDAMFEKLENAGSAATKMPLPKTYKEKQEEKKNIDAMVDSVGGAVLPAKLVVNVTAKTFAYIEGAEDREPPAPPAPPAPPPPPKAKE